MAEITRSWDRLQIMEHATFNEVSRVMGVRFRIRKLYSEQLEGWSCHVFIVGNLLVGSKPQCLPLCIANLAERWQVLDGDDNCLGAGPTLLEALHDASCFLSGAVEDITSIIGE